MPKVKFRKDGKSISYDNVHSEEMQRVLKNVYHNKSSHSRAYCCCNGESPLLLLVIALRKKTGLFELRKMPGQSASLHKDTCFFSKERKVPTDNSSSSEGSFIVMPDENNDWFADHKGLDALHGKLQELIHSEIEVKSWNHLKSELLVLSKNELVNDKPLNWILNIVRPSRSDLVDIWFSKDESRLLFGELLYARTVKKTGSVIVQFKGASEPVWFNKAVFERKDVKNLFFRGKGKRVFVLATVRKSLSGKSVQGYGMSTKILEKDFSKG